MNPWALPNSENLFWTSHLEVSAFSSNINLSPYLSMLCATSPHPGTSPRSSTAWVFASLLQPKPRLCSLPQPYLNCPWAAADQPSSLIWVQDMYNQLYHHTYGDKKTANFTNNRNYVMEYWYKLLEKGEIMENFSSSARWKGSLPTTKGGHSACSVEGLDLYNKPSLPGVIQREQGFQPQGTGRSSECRALPALYLRSHIPISVFIFQLQTRCVSTEHVL